MRIVLSRRVEAELADHFAFGVARHGSRVAERTFQRVRKFLFQSLPAHGVAMIYFASGICGFLGGILGWVVTTFVAQPLIAFLSARNEAAQVLSQFDVSDSYARGADDQTEPSSDIIAKRRDAYSSCGAKLISFDISNQV